MILNPTINTRRAHFAINNINIREASGVDEAQWENFQLVLLNDVSKLSVWLKSRQVAWSFTVAAEAWIEACMFGTSSIFVSINKNEAAEKIRYARALYEATYKVRRPRITKNNEFSLGFDNGAFIESLPSRAPRGKARRNVYLDEFAHVQKDSLIYKGALPVISKGGKVRIGSSPMGARGLFWEIYTESMKAYPGYRRLEVPWWQVRAFCKDLERAAREAPGMLTKERIDRFGTDILKLLFDNIVLEDFQQEYECIFVDELASWITWEEIARNQDADLYYLAGEFTQRNNADAKLLIDELRRGVDEMKVEYSLAGGVDIGRTRNTTEIYIGGDTTTGSMPLRLMLTLDGVEFNQQKDIISYAVKTLPIHTLYIDKNGIGMNIAEDLQREFPGKVLGFEFTNPSKKVLATDAKQKFQQNKVPIPKDRDLAYQIHSIRRKVSSAGNFIFDVETSEKHHADKFWSHALMIHALSGRRTSAGRFGVKTVK